MSDAPSQDEGYDLKQCGRCAAWIPRSATMCAYCNTSSPDSRIDPRPSRTPVGLPNYVTATRVLIAVNCIYFLISLWAQMAKHPGTPLAAFLIEGRAPRSYGLAAAGWYDHQRVVGGEWWRILTATFLHSGLIHLAVNMWSLAQLGHFAEELLGSAKFVAVYVVCGVCSTLAVSVYSVHLRGIDPVLVQPLVGASGAIFGVGGLLAAFLMRRGTEQGRRMGWSITQNLFLMLALGWFFALISNTAHVGGLVPGVLFGLAVRDRFSIRISPEARRNWWLLAALASLAALVALAFGIAFVLRHLGGSR